MKEAKDILMKGGLVIGGGLLLLYLIPHALKPVLKKREINKLKKITLMT